MKYFHELVFDNLATREMNDASLDEQNVQTIEEMNIATMNRVHSVLPPTIINYKSN